MKFRLSMLVILSIGVPASVSAAEDDVVIDGTAQQPVSTTTSTPPPGKLMCVIRDGKPIMLYTPKDRSGDVQLLEQQLTVFLKRVDDRCALNDDQMTKLKLAGWRDVQRATQKPEPIELIEEVINGKTILRVPNQPNAAQLASGTDFIATDSLVYKVLMTQLTPEQKRQFEAFQEREWNPVNRNFKK